LRWLRLDEVAEGPSVAAGRWLPLRAELGLQAFGASAYRGEPGETVVPEHRELGPGAGNHEELYVVLSGRAAFEVEGEQVDAPAGTLLRVERGETRSARAEEPGTVVLVVGAPVGEAYTVAPWEYGSRAARARALGDVGELDAAVTEGIAAYGEHVTMLVGKACVAAQRGDREQAAALLAQAYADPDLGEWAREQAAGEPLLDPLRAE
jgi:hypothetical protein